MSRQPSQRCDTTGPAGRGRGVGGGRTARRARGACQSGLFPIERAPTALHGINLDLKMVLTLGIASPTYSGHIPGSGTEQILWLLQRCQQYGLQSLQYGS